MPIAEATRAAVWPRSSVEDFETPLATRDSQRFFITDHNCMH